MLKMLGCVLLVMGGWGLGAYLVARDRHRICMGEAMLDMVRFIRAQLASFCRPRAELFTAYENAFLEEIGFLTLLRKEGDITIALAACGVQPDREVADDMTVFNRELGRTYLDGQLAACDYYTSRLETHLASRRESHTSRARVWRTVSLAGALLLALLLL